MMLPLRNYKGLELKLARSKILFNNFRKRSVQFANELLSQVSSYSVKLFKNYNKFNGWILPLVVILRLDSFAKF